MVTNWEGPLSLLARNKSAPVQESTVGTRKGLLNLIADKLAEKAKYAAGAFDPESQINQDVSSWHKKYQRGLADQIAGKDTPEAQEAYNTTMGLAGVAPIGMIAWHGSPHKFDKFDLSKIGTGEGAQAYGHGLYLAEHPATAEVYASKLTNGGAMPMPPMPTDFMVDGARYVKQDGKLAKQVGNSADLIPVGKDEYGASLRKAQQEYKDKKSAGQLYKTDIPDEAVARFLDWDKPFSQQAPEVQAALSSFLPRLNKMQKDYKLDQWETIPDWVTGGRLAETLGAKTPEASGWFNVAMREKGVPGIRYLDQASRDAGKGTSNFVVFDPEMIRILERNEIPTGLKPWEPGEYQFAKGGSVADKMRDILRPRPIVQPGTDTATTGTRGYSDDLANWSFVL